jgi:hypothetical protein
MFLRESHWGSWIESGKLQKTWKVHAPTHWRGASAKSSSSEYVGHSLMWVSGPCLRFPPPHNLTELYVHTHTLRHWVMRLRSASGSYRWTTSPSRAGTGEPLHWLEPAPVRGSFPPVGRFGKWQAYRSHRTKSVGLYQPTQRTHIHLNMISEVRV